MESRERWIVMSTNQLPALFMGKQREAIEADLKRAGYKGSCIWVAAEDGCWTLELDQNPTKKQQQVAINRLHKFRSAPSAAEVRANQAYRA